MSTTEISPTTPPTGVKPARDVRTFWRILLAVVAPLPLLGMGLSYAISPFAGNTPFEEMVAQVTAHHTATVVASALGVFFLVGLIPATYALIWITRRRTPVLTTVGALLTLPGFLAAFPMLPDDTALAQITADKSLDPAVIGALDEALWAQPQASILAVLFLAGIVIGLPILGTAMWRARVTPAWMAICLILGTVTHPFLPGHLITGIGLIVGAVGFLGVSRALLRQTNDQFDLPPQHRTS
jgi:hypothetical protein